ncbi:MAG: ABC transporter permease [Thermoleophilia bacterium]
MIRHSLLIAARINRQFLRDRRYLGMSLMVPLILMLLLKYVIDSLPGLAHFGVRVSDYSILIAAYLVHFLAYVLSTIVLVRDRTAGTLSRMFVSGYRRREIVSGYVAGYSTVAAAQTTLVLVSTRYLFDVKIERDIAAVVLTMLSLAIVSVGLGLFLSNFARNEGQVFPFIPMVIIPSALLSGMIIPIGDLPVVLQWCSYLVPLTWAVKVLRGVVVDGSSFFSLLTPFLLLLGFGLALLVLASFTLREKE